MNTNETKNPFNLRALRELRSSRLELVKQLSANTVYAESLEESKDARKTLSEIKSATDAISASTAALVAAQQALALAKEELAREIKRAAN